MGRYVPAERKHHLTFYGILNSGMSLWDWVIIRLWQIIG